jgi:hypothetical protein
MIAESVERMWFTDPQMRNPHRENRRVRHQGGAYSFLADHPLRANAVEEFYGPSCPSSNNLGG